MHTTSRALLVGAFESTLRRTSTLPPLFLVPSFSAQTATLTTTAPASARKDGNPSRGVSALRRTGLGKRQKTLSVIPHHHLRSELDSKKHLTKAQLRAAIPSILPKPVLDPERRTSVNVDENHGLWEFFNKERTAMSTPLELSNHSQPWTQKLLQEKDWDDLWKLWWVCIKEMNRLHTFRAEKKRAGSMYGDYEADAREMAIKTTQENIKHVLTQRWYMWEDARQAAMEDEEVNLSAVSEKGEKAYMSKSREAELAAPEGDSTQGTGTYNPEGILPPPESSRPANEARL